MEIVPRELTQREDQYIREHIADPVWDALWEMFDGENDIDTVLLGNICGDASRAARKAYCKGMGIEDK